MKITVSLKPALHLAGDRMEASRWILECHKLAIKKGKLPATTWSLEEWDDFDEKGSSSLKYGVGVFLAELKNLFPAFLAVNELSRIPGLEELQRCFDQVLQRNPWKGDFAQHPVLGKLVKPPKAGDPGIANGIAYELVHLMPNGSKRPYRVRLDDSEVEALRAASPKPGLSLEEFKAASTSVMGLQASKLPIQVFIREGVASYLRMAVEGVHAGTWRWRDLHAPVSLGYDRLGVV